MSYIGVRGFGAILTSHYVFSYLQLLRSWFLLLKYKVLVPRPYTFSTFFTPFLRASSLSIPPLTVVQELESLFQVKLPTAEDLQKDLYAKKNPFVRLLG